MKPKPISAQTSNHTKEGGNKFMSNKVGVAFYLVLTRGDISDVNSIKKFVDPDILNDDSDYANQLREEVSDAVSMCSVEYVDDLDVHIYGEANIVDILDCIKINSFTVDEDTVYYCKGEFNIKKYTDKYL